MNSSHVTQPDILAWIQTSTLGHAISKSNHLLIAGFQVIHVMGFVLLLSSLVLISLRLLGLSLAGHSVPKVAGQTTRLLWLGLTLAISSGVLMFIGSPRHYFDNPAFRVKMLLLLGAVLMQILLFQRVSARESATPLLARISVAISLVLWFGVSLAGRAIGFV